MATHIMFHPAPGDTVKAVAGITTTERRTSRTIEISHFGAEGETYAIMFLDDEQARSMAPQLAQAAKDMGYSELRPGLSYDYERAISSTKQDCLTIAKNALEMIARTGTRPGHDPSRRSIAEKTLELLNEGSLIEISRAAAVIRGEE